jgi:histidinol phosphatase-like PHP family hydrolase
MRASDEEEPRSTKARALRRAGRAALTWPIEASDLVAAGRSLTELPTVGPWVERVMRTMFEAGAAPHTFDPLRDDFLTATEVQRTLAGGDNGIVIKCDLQMHTTWSDGHSTLDEMVGAAALRGYTHIAITDHSKGLAIAHGMDEDRLAQQGEIIDAINGSGTSPGQMRVLRSIEVNLGLDGSIDMDSAALAGLDIVHGAFHSKLRLREDQTDRYIAALRNPDLHILGHPRGRMFNHRIGLHADWHAVFEAAARLDKAVEIDGYADRQDLNVELLGIARETGVRVSIGSDAHHVVDLGYADFGLAAAVIAGIPPDRVINTLSLDALLGWVASLRERKLVFT